MKPVAALKRKEKEKKSHPYDKGAENSKALGL